LDLELIVLFLSVSLILVIPWILHDVRFVMLVPLAFLVVPGLFGVLLKATSEFIAILAEARRKERQFLLRSIPGLLRFAANSKIRSASPGA